MKIKSLKLLLILAPAFLFLFSSCTKDEENEIDADQKVTYSQTIEDEASVENTFDDVDDIGYVAINSKDPQTQRTGEDTLLCTASVSLVTTQTGKKATIDFGTGCTDAKGNLRKGIVYVHITGGFWTPGTVVTTTFENYSVNGVKVEGKRIVTNTTANSVVKFNVTIESGKLTWPDNTTSELTMNYVKKWVSPFLNDEFHYYGTASGKDRAGVSFTATVDQATPIIYKRACFASNVFLPVSGKKVVTSSKYPGKAATIDFGNGTCDKTFTLSIEGNTAEIAL